MRCCKRSLFCCLFVGYVFGIAPLPAAADVPGGWVTRCGCPAADTDKLPVVDIAPLPNVFTNGSNGIRHLRQNGGGAFALQRVLPPCESPRVRELARGLDYDWRKCYFFVRDNIAFTSAVGFMRGAERTLVDREGSDADQALLLHELLAECGVASDIMYAPPMQENEAEPVFAVPAVSHGGRFPYNAASWLGLRESIGGAAVLGQMLSLLRNGGHGARAFLSPDAETGETNVWIGVDHFWVMASCGDGTYVLDPSFKPMRAVPARDVLAESGYSRNALIAVSGGTCAATSFTGASTSSLDSYLNGRAAALRQAWANTQNGVAYFVGGRQIIRQADDAFFHGNWCRDALLLSEQPEASVDALRTRVRLSFGSVENEFFLDELGSRRLWLSFEESIMSSPRAVLHLGDAVLWQETHGTASSALTFEIAVAMGTNAYVSATYPLRRSPSNVYVIPVGFGAATGVGMRALAAEELADARDRGWGDGDPRLLARSLHAQGHEWLAQRTMMNRFYNGFSPCPHGDFYAIGIAGQNGAPYVDFKNVSGFAGDIPEPTNALAQVGRDLFGSALEHAVLDQLNGAGLPSVSTMKVLELANAANVPVHYADSNSVASVAATLSGYDGYLLQLAGAYIALGGFSVLPQSGDFGLNSWHGSALVGYMRDAAHWVAEMAISGGYSGGYCTENSTPSAISYENGMMTALYGDGSVRGSVQADPVAMPSGAFLASATDLELKGGRTLAWTRLYDSRSRRDDGPLGRGWTHGFDATVSEGADADAVFGGGSVASAIPTALAVAVVRDLLSYDANLSAGEKARRWLLASLVVRWWTHRHVGAAVHVRHGSRTLSFQRLWDGSYAPAPGVTATLMKSGSEYRLTERLGPTYRFNSSGRLCEITDGNGNATTLTFSGGRLSRVANGFGAHLDLAWANGRIVGVSDGAGRSVAYSYDNAGRMVQFTDWHGKDWRFGYDAETHAMVSETDPLHHLVVTNYYNALCQVTNQLNAMGGATRFGYEADTAAWSDDPLGGRVMEAYDAKGRVTSRTDRCGAKTMFAYDGNGNATLRRDALGLERRSWYDARCNMYVSGVGTAGVNRVTYYAHDDRDRLVAVTNARGQVSRISYDESSGDLPCRMWKRDGRSRQNVWSSNGLLTHFGFRAPTDDIAGYTMYTYGAYGLPETHANFGVGLPAEGVSGSVTYDAKRRPLAETDANGNVRTFVYDDVAMRTLVYEADGSHSELGYDDCGWLSSVRDPLSRQTAYVRTASGQIAATVYPDGTFATNIYDVADRLVRTVDERGSWTDYVRDAEGRVLATITPAGTNSVAYDAVGRVVSETDATGRTRTFGYNLFGELAYECDGLSNVTHQAYDSLGRRVSSTDPLGRVRAWDYDSTDRIVAMHRPSGAVEGCGYDVLDNRSSVTNAEGHVYQMSYDALDRMIAATNALGACVFEAKYDGVGNMTNRVDGNGAETVSAYDVRNRLVRRTTADGIDAFSYDLAGNLLSASNSVAVETFSYDLRDRLTNAVTRISTNIFVCSWSRDAGGLVTNVVYTDGKSVARTYDLAGRLVSVTDWLGHEWTFAYDAAYRPTGGTSPSGTSHSFSYDAAGRLSAWSVTGVAGRMIERDAAGRRVRDTVTAGLMPAATLLRNAENTFDAADRLVSAKAAYNGSHNPVQETFLYDGNGAMTNATSGGETVFSAAYDAQGRLASLEGSAAFSYDALGNRVCVGGHIFIPDHSDPLKRPLVECDADGNPIRYYIWGPGRLLGFIDAADTLAVAHSDEQGSVIALTDENGELLFRTSYSPHGEDWGSSGTNVTPFAWLGGLGVMRIGGPLSSADASPFGQLYLTRHRLYSPVLRRFLSADPLGIDGGLNLYAYANCDPLAYIDPLGLCAMGGDGWTRIAGFFQMIGGGVEATVGYGFAGLTAETGVGIAAGVAVGLHGTDVAIAGYYAMVNGVPQDTLTSQGLQAVGVPQDWANGIDAGVSMVGTMGVGAAARGAIVTVEQNSLGMGTARKAVEETGKLQLRSAPRFSEDASALIKLSKQVRRSGVSREDAQTLLEWAREYNVPAHGPEQHLNRNFKDWHIHIGPIDHIIITP